MVGMTTIETNLLSTRACEVRFPLFWWSSSVFLTKLLLNLRYIYLSGAPFNIDIFGDNFYFFKT